MNAPAMAFDVHIDPVCCGGTSECVHALPELFRLDENGRAQVHGDPGRYSREDLLAAAWMCPTSAISIREDGVELDPDPSRR